MLSRKATLLAHTDFPILDIDGVRVSITRNDDTAQIYVCITTEDANEFDAPDGIPAIQVDLNDAKLYDVEPA